MGSSLREAPRSWRSAAARTDSCDSRGRRTVPGTARRGRESGGAAAFPPSCPFAQTPGRPEMSGIPVSRLRGPYLRPANAGSEATEDFSPFRPKAQSHDIIPSAPARSPRRRLAQTPARLSALRPGGQPHGAPGGAEEGGPGPLGPAAGRRGVGAQAARRPGAGPAPHVVAEGFLFLKNMLFESSGCRFESRSGAYKEQPTTA